MLGVGCYRRSDRGGSLDQESFLDRIERLAYTDKRRQEASRVAIADHVHNSECTFRPAINPRSARMVRVSGAGCWGGAGRGACKACWWWEGVGIRCTQGCSWS